ncbi:hypothetical protein [Nostoc sp. C052]|nr:hypothetical protein [Nostoc sp. C052]
MTKYIHITDLGKQFLVTREKLQSSNQEEITNAQETPYLVKPNHTVLH